MEFRIMKGLIYLIVISLFTFVACDEENLNTYSEEDSITTPKLPYEEIPQKEYTIDLKQWDIPSDGTQPVKTTDNLQAAIDWAVSEGYGIIKLPAGHYLVGKYGNAVYQAGIELKSNMAFLLDEDAILEMAPNDKWNSAVIQVKRKQNVFISGGTILGDRDNHIYTPRDNGSDAHDEGHLILIEAESEYVTVENMTLSKATGDGILLVAHGEEGSSVKHVDIRRNNIFNNRRQGISIVGGTDILIEENEIHHINGTAPQFGIDIESLDYTSADILIRDNHFHHNSGGDIVNTDGCRVIVEDNILEQGEGSEYVDGPLVYWKNADMTIRGNDITMLSQSVNTWHGIIMYSNDKPKTNPATTYIYENTLNNCGVYMYKGADLEIRDNHFINGHMAFKEMTNLKIVNNRFEEESHFPWIFSFKTVTGEANGNTVDGEIYEIPLSSTPYSAYLK